MMDSTNHMMVDIETLGKLPTAVVLSIGVAVFNREFVSSFHWTLDIQEQLEWGRTIDGETLAWWVEQDEGVRRETFQQEHSLDVAFALLTSVVRTFEVKYFWAHSPSFDMVILNDLWRHKPVMPWSYRQWLDTRTLGWLKTAPSSSRTNIHNAQSDAERQAQWVRKLLCE